MTVETHLRVAGTMLLVLAAMHVPMARRLRWRAELSRVSPLTRQVFWVHTGFITLLLTMMGLLSAVFTDALVAPGELAPIMLWGLALFWGLRLLTQWFVYDRSHWRGKRGPTAIHLCLTVMWAYLTGVYGYAAWLLSE